jgi:hypothetical protein
VKVAGQWRYVYRAIDQFGQVIDVFQAVAQTGVWCGDGLLPDAGLAIKPCGRWLTRPAQELG